jgi:uncharacterized membrane protein
MEHVTKSITVMRPRAELFQFWRNLENLPRFMHHLKHVAVTDARRSHWVAKAPAGTEVEWDAEVIDEELDEFISWRSVEGSEIHNAGSVRFKDAPADRGTEIEVEFVYDAPAGKVGAIIAKLFGEEPTQQVTDDLRRFKQVMETGEVVRSEGSLEGAGEGASKERPAQAPAIGARS